MGILDAPAPRTYRPSLFAGLPIVASRGNGFSVNTGNQSDGVNTSANYRTMHVFTSDCTDLRFVIGNHYNGDNLNPNPISVQLGVEVPFLAAISNTGQVGDIRPITFRGQRLPTLDPGGFLVSDPLPVTAKAGQIMYIHSYVSVASAGQTWPLDLYTYSANWEGNTKGAPDTNRALTSGIAQVTGPAYSPVAILGTPVTGHPSCVAFIGDSIAYGSGDTTVSLGFLVRALNAAGIPYMQTCKPGEQGSSRAGGGYLNPGPRQTMTAGCTHAIEQYGQNDRTNGRTLAQIQADRLTIATAYATRGIKVWATTNTPNTTSSDSWATTAGQTVTATESVRVALNTWLRAGAPIDPSTKVAVAVGTSGALLAGQAGHPHLGYFEVADAVETARNSGLWKVTGAANGWTVDGTHPSATGHAAMAATIDVSKLR